MLKEIQKGFIFKNIATAVIIKKFKRYLKNNGQTPVFAFKKLINVEFEMFSNSMLPEYFEAVKMPVNMARRLIKQSIIIVFL